MASDTSSFVTCSFPAFPPPCNKKFLISLALALEETSSTVDLPEVVGEDKRKDSHELHNDVESRAGSILEGITNSVSNDSSLVDVTSLTLEIGLRRGPLNVLLGVVPSSSGVGHGDGELDGGDEGSDEEAGDSVDSEEGSSEEGGEHDHGSGGDHLPEGGDGGDLDAGIVVGALGGMLVKKVGLLGELPGDLHDHLHGGKADRLHGHGGEPERDHASDDEEGKGEGLEHVDAASLGEDGVLGEGLDADDEGSEEGERDKGGRSDGESLSNGSGGVSGGVQGVGLLPNSGLELGHLGDSSSVVADRSVDVNGEAGGEVGEHTDGSKTDSVEVEEGERGVDDATEDDDGDDGTLVSEGDSVDHVGGGSSLATVGDLTDGGVGVGSVVLGDEADDESTDDTGSDADEGGPGLDGLGDSDSGDDHVIGEEDGGEDVDSGEHDEGGGDELGLEGELDVGLLLDGHDVSGDEGADKADEDSDGGDGDGEEKGIPSSIGRGVDGSTSNDKGGACGLGEGAEEVDPIPATSPTLSPTLSAMVAGLRGSSSGIPWTTFPTRSAPTSAALV